MAQCDYHPFLGKRVVEMIKKLNLCDFLVKQRKECNNNVTMTEKKTTKKRKREVLDKWLFCLDRFLEFSYIMKKIESYHDMVSFLITFQ